MPQANVIPNTLGDVIQRIQGLAGDKTGYLYSRNYLVPLINQAYEEMALQIKNASGKNFEALVELLAVPQGTSDLSDYQKWDGPNQTRGQLFGLFDPIRMWVKTAGALPQFYTEAYGPRDTLPHVQPPGITPGNYAVIVTYAWIGYKLSITPVAGPTDIQVYGRFDPPPLQKDEDQLMLYPRMTMVLASATLAWTGIERSNTTIFAGAEQQAVAGVDNIVADIIRQCQKNPRRLAKMGNSTGSGWYGWGQGLWY